MDPWMVVATPAAAAMAVAVVDATAVVGRGLDEVGCSTLVEVADRIADLAP